MKKFTFVDLFAGIGGFHLAMDSLGGECVFASEIDKYARKTYEYNFKKLNKKLFENGIIGGFDLGKYYPELENVIMFAVTEKRTKEEIDKLCKVLEEA